MKKTQKNETFSKNEGFFTALVLKFMWSNVAYRLTVYENGGQTFGLKHMHNWLQKGFFPNLLHLLNWANTSFGSIGTWLTLGTCIEQLTFRNRKKEISVKEWLMCGIKSENLSLLTYFDDIPTLLNNFDYLPS